jgi:hypothetical protein
MKLETQNWKLDLRRRTKLNNSELKNGCSGCRSSLGSGKVQVVRAFSPEAPGVIYSLQVTVYNLKILDCKL